MTLRRGDTERPDASAGPPVVVMGRGTGAERCFRPPASAERVYAADLAAAAPRHGPVGVPILGTVPDEEHGFLLDELDRAPPSGNVMGLDLDSSRENRRLALR